MSKASASQEQTRRVAPEPNALSLPARAANRQESVLTPAFVRDHGRWLAFALLAGTLVWIVAWHGDAALRMAETWWTSETFAHGLIVYPVALWLIWRQRQRLAQLPIEPSLLALAACAAAGFIALLGELGNVQAARQFGMVAMLPLAVVAVLGIPIARAIAFPLAFTLLAVPVGEFLLPTLMQHTADFTVSALRLTGIPVYREGLYFTVPSGRWSVIEACSGLRYLIASITLGLLYAYLTYRSLWRRVVFVAASIAVPIVANWLRAYMIVMIGHLSEMKYAVGVDHLIYGWLFFGVVMLLLFWLGSLWREPLPPAEAVKVPPQNRHVALPASIVVAALGVAGIASAGPLYVAHIESGAGALARAVSEPEAAGGWTRAESRLPHFQPHYLNARSSLHLTYEKGDRQVGLFIAYYFQQREGAELVGFANDLVAPISNAWKRLGQHERRLGSGSAAVTESRLESQQGQLLAWHWYWVGGRSTVHREEVKLRQAVEHLLAHRDDAAVVVVYTAVKPSIRDDSDRVLGDFLQAMGPAIRDALRAVSAAEGEGNRSVSRATQ